MTRRFRRGSGIDDFSVVELSPLPHERSNIFSYLAAVINGKIDPANDLSSFTVNAIVVEILSAAVQSAKTGKTIYLKK